MSRDYELRVIEDVIASPAVCAMDAAHRVIYLVQGDVAIITGAATVTLSPNQAWQGSVPCRVTAGAVPARVWRWELRDAAKSPDSVDRVKLAHRVQLDSDARSLMRCDRVDFPPGGVAYTHVHQGPGIRMLLRGTFRVETAGHTLHLEPGQPWFESGPDPVYAVASPTHDTAFIRVMILPEKLQGKSSIRYVNPEDQAKPKSQRYTIFVDAPIAL